MLHDSGRINSSENFFSLNIINIIITNRNGRGGGNMAQEREGVHGM